MARLVVALPVRNGAHLLPGWFAAVEGWADAVVALDDGSTDDTGAVLRAHPRTAVVLENPRRDTYAGWDDATNRQRLVDAAVEAGADWVLQLDADEHLGPGDGPALRRAIDAGELDPACGYLLRVLRMVEVALGPEAVGRTPDPEPSPRWDRKRSAIPPPPNPVGAQVEVYDQDQVFVGRLFAGRPGICLPRQELHLVPLPVDIPPERRLRTTLRICHEGSRTAAHRRARVAKYAEVDPTDAWDTRYERLLAEPGVLQVLADRPESLPVVAHTPCTGERARADDHPADEPLLTAVVIARNERPLVERALDALAAQEVTGGLQVVVVTSGRDDTAEFVRARYPGVEVVELGRPALPGAARNAGLARARGRYITFPGSHITLEPGALEARLQAHLAGWGMVAGTTKNGTTTPAGWASYFLDHCAGLPSRPSHPMTMAPSSASYLTEALRAVGGFPTDVRTAEDSIVNTALWEQGYGAWREQAVLMVHHSPCADVGTLLRHHHLRGRGYGTLILHRHRPEQGPVLSKSRLVTLGLRYVPGRLHRIHHLVSRDGDRGLRRCWLRVSPLALLAVVSAWAGAWRELLRPRPGGWALLTRGEHHDPTPVHRGGPRETAIFVAAGHGGEDPGSIAGDLVERDLNAAVAARLVDRLRDHGFVVHTDLDHGNPPFPAEVELAGAIEDLAYYVAVHHNAHESSARGAEAFARPGPARTLAESLHSAQLAALRRLDPTLPDRGVKDGTGTGAAKHLDRAPGLAVVLEPCFLTSNADAALCRHPAYVDTLAEALADAIVDHGHAEGRWNTTSTPASATTPPPTERPVAR